MLTLYVCGVCREAKPVGGYYAYSSFLRSDGTPKRVCRMCSRVRRKANRDRQEAETGSHSQRRWLVANRAKAYASVAVCAAVREGRMKRGPCEVCGAGPAEGHHDDYSKRYDVRWLCKLHHKAVHMSSVCP